eukprot:TRINITY_DN39406_c0_g1_i1.p1 TRINITY_DN39406_c0_g1~~TRINITY_DN39406_c0_g1_i1.p1  ORF type:complete len:397 (-),score=66.82 TRINITY_DN39406_c0_g1_i1:132-1238(-)
MRCLVRAALWAGGLSALPLVSGDIEQERRKCIRDKQWQPARKPGDLNATFLPILNGEKWAELSPKVMSTDPWVIYFEKFMTEEEVQALELNLFGPKQQFMDSPAGGSNGNANMARHSETAFCTGDCDAHATVQAVRKRASEITHTPPSNFDFSQALRYKVGMYYRSHHDNHPTFHYLPSGARTFTYFVYLSDEGLVGGATYFPLLNITAPAKRGAAVLFVNTKDRNPMETDPRTEHESQTVNSGLKRGMNMWLYNYEYRSYWQKACTSIELADQLGRYGKSTAPFQPNITFHNNAQKATLHVFDVRDRGGEFYMGAVGPGSALSVRSVEGNVLHVRKSKTDKKTLMEHSVRASPHQKVNIGKPKKAEL